ncbi:serine/arginine repetitive matrix protein 1-like [Amphibalanus amphitrite]|uniref:serine/arginine repetitive matrix protein 1-like n=1 Tax=Amphibalanus amphitrite TaxID=1232801 RepID=UPI001C909729|nr:serine/arginine repetitive matrix protein 1-like [Amphibalanus amphitrite]
MGFFPNLFQNPQTYFKGKKWAKRQENSRYDQHRNRLLKVRPVVDTDPPRAYRILTKRLLYKRRKMGIDTHGIRTDIGPDTESLKDWKACRQRQPSPAAALEPTAAQLKRLISAEELTHSLAELERSASRALGQPPPPPVTEERPELSSSQLVEQVHELERSLTELAPPAALPPLQPWVAVRRAEWATGGAAAAAGQTPGRANSVAAAGGGGAPALGPARPTGQAAGDFWVTTSPPQESPVTYASRQTAPYITINNQKIPILISQYSVQAHQKVHHTMAPQAQEITAPEPRNVSNVIREELNESKILTQTLQLERNQVPWSKKPMPAPKLSPITEQAANRETAVQRNNPGQKDDNTPGQKQETAESVKAPAGPDTKEAESKAEQNASEVPDDAAEPICERVKIVSEKRDSIRPVKVNGGNKANSSNNVASKETKTKKRRPTKPANTDTKRENHSDTEVETTERKHKIETCSQDKRTSYSDNTQPMKVFFKKKPTNPKIEYVELAERSTQTVQHTQSETVTSRDAKPPPSPERTPSGRSKSEHTIQRSADSRSTSRRAAKLTFAVSGSGSGVAVGPDQPPVRPLVRPLTDRSVARAALAPGRNRSPSPPLRPAAIEAQRRVGSPPRQQSTSSQQQRQQSASSQQQQRQSASNQQQQQRQPSPAGHQPPQRPPGSGRQPPPSAPRSSGRRSVPATPRSQRSQRSGGRGPPGPQDSRAITTTIRPPARPGSGRKTAARRRLQRLRGKVKEPPGHLSRGNASNIITTPGDSGGTSERRATQASCAMCVGDQQPQNRTERVRRVIHRVTAVISPDSSPPASPGRSQPSPRAAARRHRQLLTRIDALAAPRRRYTEQADNQVRQARPNWRPPAAPLPGDQLYQRAMRGASCRSCNIVRTPSPISSNPFAFMDIEADGRPLGRLTILLRADLAPRTVENFRSLCTGEYGFGYKGTLFHRVIPRFVCQGGDVTFGGRNKQAPLSIYDRLFEDESFDMHHSEPGVVSMVNNGPNTNGTQFFICAAKITWLDGKNVAFGLVTEGLQVLRKIEALGTAQGVPLKRIVVHKCGQIIND